MLAPCSNAMLLPECGVTVAMKPMRYIEEVINNPRLACVLESATSEKSDPLN